MKFITHFIPVILLCLLFGNTTEAQVYKWKKLRYELIAGGGISNFMGDVGAPVDEGIARYFWTNVNTWKPVAVIGGRMAFSERHKVKTMLTIGYLYAHDAYGDKTNNQFEVRTSITELSAQYEFYIIREQEKRNIYNFLGASQRLKNLIIPTYVFSGVSGLYFNPKTLFNDEWVALHDYNTEVLPNGNDSYSRITLAVPIGAGIKFKITKYISANIEAGWRLAFTDYIDDLGAGDYPDFEEAIANGNYERMALSWRAHGFDRMSPELENALEEKASNLSGSSRGAGEWFDQYQFVTLSLNFKLKTGRKGKPRLRLYR